VEFLSLRGSQAFFLHQSILVGVIFHFIYGMNQSTEVDPGIWRFAKALYFWGSFKRPDTQPGASLKREKTQAFRQIPTDPYHSYPMGLERRVAWTYKPKNIGCHFRQTFLADLFAADCGASFNVPRRTIQNL
jgi:hypothetical protein